MKCTILLLLLYHLKETSTRSIHKRQLFREQLLPNMGGKVPESAFQTDRLALNQLNARGIYSSSGVYLEHRHPKEHPSIIAHNVKTMKVTVPADGRFVGEAGRYHYRMPPTVDTTYAIREPVAAAIKAHLLPSQRDYPLVPHTSLKLARYYQMRKVDARAPHKNDIDDDDDVDDFVKHVKEYQPYLKKIHEVD